MKKISLVLCFALMLVLLFAFNAFAATQNNIAKDARLENDGSTSNLIDQSKVVDGDYNTASSCGNSGETWVNYRFFYDKGVTVSKVRVILNSTGTLSKNGTVYEELSDKDFTFFVRLYKENNKDTYYNQSFSSKNMDVIKEFKDDGNTLYTYFEIEFETPYTEVYQVEVPVVNNRDADVGLWEVEIYNYVCEEGDTHNYSEPTCAPATCYYCGATTGEPVAEHTWADATCAVPMTCTVCKATSGEPNTEHTWADATCAVPMTCTVCGATTGEPNTELHVWKNASYAEPATCRLCGATTGDVWTDSTLPNFVRGEHTTIEYSDLIGDGQQIVGVKTHGEYYYMFDRDWATSCGTHSAKDGYDVNGTFRITFKNEWEIDDAQLIVFANHAGLKVAFYAADGTCLGEHTHWGLSINYDYFDGKVPTNPEYTSYNNALKGVNYTDKAVKYIEITNVDAKWKYLPAVVEIYLSGRERIPAACTEHEFEEVITKQPTCLEKGSKQNICTICGAAEGAVDIPALGHNIGEYTIDVPANCNTAATITFDCTRCSETITRDMFVKDVTDFADKDTISTKGAGGDTSSAYALFDNNLNSYLHASGQWFVESSIELDMPYYLTSVTVWTGSYSDNASWEANFTFWYQAPGSDEWIEVGTKAAGVGKAGEKYAQTLEIAEPVYADAIKIKVNRLASYNGQAFEAEVAGTLFNGENVLPLGHTWEVTEVVPSACYAGYKLSTCTVCGETKQDEFTKAVGHQYTYACDVACNVCHEVTREASHTIVKVDAVAPTCNANGNIEYYNCTICGYAWLDEACTQVTNQMSIVVPATGHGEAVIKEEIKPTCTDPGSITKVCAECGEVLSTEPIEPIGHTVVHVEAKPGTDCKTWDGNKEYWYCSVCGAAWTDADCTEVTNLMSVARNGEHKYTYACDKICCVCYELTNEAAEHTIEKVEAKAATCTENGNKEYYNCTICGYAWLDEACTQVANQFSIVVPATGHSYRYACDKVCQVCHEITNPDADHTIVHVDAVAATCTENGNVEYWYCTICGVAWTDAAYTQQTNLMSVTIPALGHENSYDDDVYHYEGATCSTEGYVIDLCAVCGETFTTVIPKDTVYGHQEDYTTAESKDATCKEDGYYRYTCLFCGEKFETIYKASPNYHQNETTEYVAPTCKTAGYEIKVCSVCGEETRTDYPASEYAHKWDDGVEIEGGIRYTCTLCGTVDEEITKGTANDPIIATIGNNTFVYYNTDEEWVVYQLTTEKAGTYTITVDSGAGIFFGQSLMELYWGGSFETGSTSYEFDVKAGVYMLVFTIEEDYDIPASFNVAFEKDVEPSEYATKFDPITVETTDTYGYLDLYSYTAKAEGQYSFFVPAGLGFASKELYDSGLGDVAEVGFYDNAFGAWVTVDLKAGQPYEFYVAATKLDTWTIDVYFYHDVHTEVEIPAVPGNNNASNPGGSTSGLVCSVCGTVTKQPEAIDKSFRFSMISLALGENINLLYSVSNASAYDKVYVVFEMNGVEYLVENYTIQKDGRYCFEFEGIRLQFMADNVKATVYGVKNGVVSANCFETYSAKQYIVNNLNKTATTAELRTVLSDLLVLGAQAQVYAAAKSDYQYDVLMTEGVANMTPSTFAGVPVEDNIQSAPGEKNTIADWAEATLLIGNATTLQYKLRIDNTVLDKVSIQITIDRGELEPRVETYTKENLVYEEKTGLYVLKVENLKVNEYGSEVVGNIFIDGEQFGRVFTYSVNSYAYRNQNNGDAVTVEFLRKLYTYGKSAAAYVATLK